MNAEVTEKIDNIELTNQALILRAKTGDAKSIAKLCEFNRKYIYSVLIVRTRGNRELSEDLTQDILIRIISNLDKYENTGYKFRSWVSKVIKSTHIDHVRKEKCRIESYATSVDFTEAGGEDDFKTNVLDYNVLSHVSVEQDFIKAEASARMKEIIQEGIESLGNASQKRAIVLNLFEDLSYNEIAEKLGVSLDVTKSLIYRAKQGILKNIVANNYHIAGTIVDQMIIQESVLNGASNKNLAKRFEMSVDEVNVALEGSLKKVYRYKFYGDGVKVGAAV